MNSTIFSDPRDVIGFGVTYTLAVLAGIFFAGFLILFPFYVYVNKVNRFRDELTLVFPITNHFYEMMKKVYILFLYLIASVFLTLHFLEKEFSLLFTLPELTCILCIAALCIIMQVFHVLISLLALQKSILYFFPSTERAMCRIFDKLQKNFWVLYLIFVLKHVICLTLAVICVFSKCEQRIFSRLKLFYSSVFLILNLFVILSSLLYIPIVSSIKRNFSYLPIAQTNKPERYILYQIVLILVFKLISCCMFLYAFFLFQLSSNWPIPIIMILDIMMVPLIVEISYLGSNKRNVQTLFSSFNLLSFLKVLLDFKVESNTVQPTLSITEASNRLIT
ncbi:hypothetical protein CAEBREN_23273 [Caenorhabditis brenneri]|uniref:Serpentine Receptor, class Z n=1 Tax=Caenorhabditis brenneri TaxID=135651 RepID=G0NQ78_CAEBE|nr:hypothetical protein CAEBREN_23273 [Caenorhabditis brenneri]